MRGNLFILSLTFYAVITSSKFPNVSNNEKFCMEEFLKHKVHQCHCETFDEEYLKTSNSFIKFWVSKKNVLYVLVVEFTLNSVKTIGYLIR